MVARAKPSVPGPLLTYRIDADDRLIQLSPHWAESARQHDAVELLPERVTGLCLWDMLADDGVRELYQGLVMRVRRGREIRFNYRCDTADLHRVFAMEMRPVDGTGVLFSTLLVRAEVRPPVALLDPNLPRDVTRALAHCSWCQRVSFSGKHWIEIEHAVNVLGLATTEAVPRLEHGMCQDCRSDLSRHLHA